MLPRSADTKIIDPPFLLTAYCSGYFPMADPVSGEISWYSPDPRGIFDLDEFHIPRSLRLAIKKNEYEIRLDSRFEEVMRSCAAREETWISEAIVQSYLRIYRLGHAHSVEVWKNEMLAGGLYGVAIRGAFFGESMFSRVKDTSKIALAHLVDRLKSRGYALLDTQFITPHLKRFGAKEIPHDEYLIRLERALRLTCSFL